MTKRDRLRGFLKLSSTLLMLVGIPGCTMTASEGIKPILSFCDGYSPGIRWSRGDTAETVVSIKAKNRVYKDQCLAADQ